MATEQTPKLDAQTIEYVVNLITKEHTRNITNLKKYERKFMTNEMWEANGGCAACRNLLYELAGIMCDEEDKK